MGPGEKMSPELLKLFDDSTELLVQKLLEKKKALYLKQLMDLTFPQPGQIIPVKDVDAVLYVDAQTLREQEFWDGLK